MIRKGLSEITFKVKPKVRSQNTHFRAKNRGIRILGRHTDTKSRYKMGTNVTHVRI
jgi:hypothetical protein